jgi:hypothetical protein
MGPGDPQVFKGVTLTQFSALQAKVVAAGLAIAGYSGTAYRMGVELSWSYDPISLLLTVTVLKSGFFLSPESLNAQIARWVQECAQSSRT